MSILEFIKGLGKHAINISSMPLCDIQIAMAGLGWADPSRLAQMCQKENTVKDAQKHLYIKYTNLYHVYIHMLIITTSCRLKG